MPPPHQVPDRLDAVLAVVYLIFNEGYAGRVDLSAEAIRLGRALAELMPDEPEVHGLLALMLVNDASRDARFAEGVVVLLRGPGSRALESRSDRGGRTALDRPWRSVAVAHTSSRPRSRCSTSTNLRTGRSSRSSIGELASMTGSPVVELNRAAAHRRGGGRRERARSRRQPGSRRVPLPPRHACRAPSPSRPPGRGARRVRPRTRARPLGARAALPRAATGRASRLTGRG